MSTLRVVCGTMVQAQAQMRRLANLERAMRRPPKSEKYLRDWLATGEVLRDAYDVQGEELAACASVLLLVPAANEQWRPAA